MWSEAQLVCWKFWFLPRPPGALCLGCRGTRVAPTLWARRLPGSSRDEFPTRLPVKSTRSIQGAPSLRLVGAFFQGHLSGLTLVTDLQFPATSKAAAVATAVSLEEAVAAPSLSTSPARWPEPPTQAPQQLIPGVLGFNPQQTPREGKPPQQTLQNQKGFYRST